jgi:hypothetical protein
VSIGDLYLDPREVRRTIRERLAAGPSSLMVLISGVELRHGVTDRAGRNHFPRQGWGPLVHRHLVELGAVRDANGRWGLPA